MASSAIDVGGSGFTDPVTGVVYAADPGPSIGTATQSLTWATIGGTTNDALFQSTRWGKDFTYNVNLADGLYEVELNFAEIYWSGAGQRVFDVHLEGQEVISNLDVFTAAGGKNIAYTVTKTVAVSGGQLNLRLEFNGADDRDQAEIAGFAVRRLDGPPPTPGTPVNTVPGAQTIPEDQTRSITGIQVADADSTSLTTQVSVLHGTLQATGAGVSGSGTAQLTLTGTAAQINTALQSLTYKGTLDYNGPDTLTVLTRDEGNRQDSDTVAITVTPQSAPATPVNTVPGAQTIPEDQTRSITGIQVADADSTSLTTQVSVLHGTLQATGAGVSGSGTAQLTLTGTAAQINTALQSLTYKGTLDYNGPDTLTVLTRDEGNRQDSDTVAITVTPEVTTGPAAAAVDVGGSGFTDPVTGVVYAADPGPSIGTATQSLTWATIGGTTNDALFQSTRWGKDFTYNVNLADGLYEVELDFAEIYWSGAGQRVFDVHLEGQEVISNLDVFTAAGGKNIAYTVTKTVTVSGGQLNLRLEFNGADDRDQAEIAGFAVRRLDGPPPTPGTPVNTVPGAQTIPEDQTRSITGIQVADADSTSLTTQVSVLHGTLQATGAGVSGSGTAQLTLTGTAAQINTALQSLTYKGTLDYNGPDTLTVLTRDEGNRQDSDTVAITVTPQSAPATPVNTVPGAQTIPEDQTRSITGIQVADADSTSLTTQVSVLHGTLQATGAGVSGSGTAQLTLTGTAAQINTALQSLTYKGTLDYNGPDTLTVLTRDEGNRQDSDTVAITVVPEVTTGPAAAAVDVGGSGFTDPVTGVVYAADPGPSIGTATPSLTWATIGGTTNDALFQTTRWGKDFTYNVDLADGRYEVELNFAEIYWSGAGQRVFDVHLEGQEVISNLDVFTAAGGKNIAYTVTKTVTVSGGQLNLRLESNGADDRDQADITGFAIRRIEGPPPPVTTLSFEGESQAKVVDLADGVWTNAAKILPLGDSITHGWDNTQAQANWDGYRQDLWDMIQDAGLWIDYVGSERNGLPSFQDRDHRGISGIEAAQLKSQVPAIAAAYGPDVVLLMIGTNDALQRANAPTTVPADILNIMQSLEAANPNVTILVASLPPLAASDANQRAVQINAQLPGVVSTAVQQGINAKHVPLSLTAADLGDGVHPTQAGYAKIADAFFSALQQIASTGTGTYNGTPTAIASVVTDVMGSDAGDSLRGDGNANRLNGRSGADYIEGAGGNDFLSGGLGLDHFVFRPGHGADTITDFSQNNADRIVLLDFDEVTSFADLAGHITADGTGMRVDLTAEGGGTIKLDGFAGTLTANDFWFG